MKNISSNKANNTLSEQSKTTGRNITKITSDQA